MIRPATDDDLDEILALEELLFGDEAWSREQVVAELQGTGRIVQVAAEDDAPVRLAAYAVTLVVGDTADLLRLGVRPDRQRAGLATALTAAAAREAKRARALRMLLEVADSNEAARALYDAVGFVEIDRRPRYYRDGSDALVLALDL